MKIFEVTQPLEEGPNDPHIFKAVFMAGGPGSGKSYVASKLFKGTGLRMINSDEIYEYMMGKENLPLDPDTIFSPRGQEIRDKAKQITNRKQSSHLDGRLGLIIDGTGKDVAKIDKANEILRELGYDTIMLFVNTSLEIAQDRNLQRPRSLDPKQVDKMWNAVQQNIMAFQQVFGSANFYVVDNSGGLEDPDRAKNFNQVEKNIRKFLSSPPSNRAATKWIADQKSSKDPT
jgi:dephospho-CoA kinase